MENCKELFLEDIAKISIHPVAGCQFPIPSFVQGVSEMKNCTLSTPVLTFGQSESMIIPVEGSMSAKCTQDIRNAGILCTFDIAANIENDTKIVRNTYNSIANTDHYVSIRTLDGNLYLCYTLPNTFRFNAPVTIKGTKTRQINISLKAYSEFIPITIN